MQQKFYLLKVVIFTPIIYIWSSIIVEFSYRIQDLMNNKSAHGFLNRQDPFLWYECVSHITDLWKSENINYNNLQNELQLW